MCRKDFLPLLCFCSLPCLQFLVPLLSVYTLIGDIFHSGLSHNNTTQRNPTASGRHLRVNHLAHPYAHSDGNRYSALAEYVETHAEYGIKNAKKELTLLRTLSDPHVEGSTIDEYQQVRECERRHRLKTATETDTDTERHKHHHCCVDSQRYASRRCSPQSYL